MPDDHAIESVMGAFEEYKKANDANQKKRDDNLEAKLANIDTHLNKFESANQQLTLAGEKQKAMQEQLDRVEAILNRADMGGVAANGKEAKEIYAAFDRVMRKPADARDAQDMALLQRQAALVTSNDAGAGYLLAPSEMQLEIVKNIIELSPMRTLATVRTIGSASLKQPKKTGSGAASRVGETQRRTNTGDPAYGMFEATAPEMFARVEVSQQMLEDSEYDLMAELREDAGEQFAVREGQEHISGAGAANQAEGILTNADVGYSVSGAAAAITADGLIDLFYGIKTGYARNGVFVLNRLTISAIRKLKDGAGQYLWLPGIANNVPNTILGAPYVEMPDMPNIGANAYPVAFGDFRRGYVIVDRVAISFQVDYTTGADDGLVIFRGRKRTGGGVRQAEAIRKLKISV
ncbi:phage major capsid protein [Duganella sp. FT92W]|uniref:Phage major capsid protein n=1 Tax=Pseudoduganella rivuli TaxID=2666085 RepID=A0A7X2LSS2_9BURK|nr:phage major capsid protein [Pseudoduganella rivuli]MRV72556.1 phage major capsid protein [Pseudoduganella rivuli]